MKKTLFFFILVSFTLIQSINSQNKMFALGFEGIHYPVFQYTADSMQDLNCNLWSGSNSNSEHNYFLDILKSHGVIYSLFMPQWSQTRAWGQQTIYQADSTDLNGNTIPKYKYNNHWSKGIDYTDNTSYGNGKRVRYYQASNLPNNPNSGYVLSGADENFEPVGSIIWWRTDEKYDYKRTEGNDSLNRWYIMPRMRIDSAFARNNPNVNVARIEIYSYDSSKVGEVILKCFNFLNNGINYDGRYLEEYFNGQNPLDITISANNINGLNKGRSYGNGPDPNACGVDFKIYWYETTNLWIDYVKIEDKYAHDLFKGQNNDSLLDEMGDFLNHSNSDIFTGAFTEEMQLNNIPCINYINSLFTASFPGDPRARVLSLVNEYTNTYVGRQKPDARRNYLNNSGAKPLIINNNYQFWRGQSWSQNYWLPPSVPPSAYHFNANIPAWVQNEITDAYNSNRTSYSQYNSYLQNLVLQSWADTCRSANELTKSFNSPKDWWVVENVNINFAR